MKQIKLFICLLLVSMTCALSAQTTGFNYQAVIRDAGFSPIGNTFGTAQVSILNGGTEVYRENHNISTDAVGLFNLIIGRGTALVGNFGALDWGSGNRFVQVSVTINGTTYNFAQSELQAVPYAKVAERTLLGDGDASPTNEIQTLSITGNLISLSSGGGTISLPPNSGTDSQTLSVAGNDLSISNGNTITLPAGPTGPQGPAGTPGAAGTAGATGAQGPAGATGATGAPGPAGANGAQGLAGATGATGAQGLVGPAGAQGPAGSTGATGPQGPPGSPAPNYSGGAGISVAGAVITNTGDLSDINEIQAISIAGDVISLSNGGGSINLPPNSGTDSQTLSVAGNDLSISNGNTITLPAGPTGPAGPIGAAGAQGPMGVPGPQGAMGTAGPAGATGANGPQGDPGPAGPPGPTYSAGTGINISGNTIINTGDTDASDDLTTASVAGGDLSGPFSNLQIGANTIGTNEITNASITAADLAPGVIPVSLWAANGNDIFNNNTGRVGIGTNTPDRLLSISNDNSSILELDVRYTGFFAPIAILSRARGTKAAPTAILNNDDIGYLGYAGYDGASFGRSASIYSKATQNFSGSGKGSSLIFQTTPNDQSFPVDRMLINHNGAIGVSGVPNDNIIFTVGTDATNKIGAIIGRISSSGNSISGINQGIGSGIYGVSENGPGGFFVEAGGANSKAMSTTGDVEMNFGADGTDKLLLNFIGATTRDFEFSNVSGAMDGRLLSSEHEYGLIGTSFRAMWRVAANNFIASTAASYLNYSDQKIKENIAPMQGSLAKLMQLKPVQYDLTKEHYYAGRKGKTEAGRLNETGFVAQELEEVFPKLVQTTEAGLKAASYVGLIPTITASVQEQQVQIETLQKKNEELEARILRLEALLSKK